MSGAECRRSRVQEPLLSGKQAGSFPSLLSLQYRQLVWSTSTICTSINGLKQDGGSVSVMITKCPPSSVCRIARLRMARGRAASRSHKNWHAIQKHKTSQVLTVAEVDNLINNPSHVQSYVANQNGPNGFCFLLS